MNRDKQIEEMANIIALKAFERAHLIDGDENLADVVATDLYNAGYRKIADDHARQCTCYALGCQMAEELKRDVVREIFEEIDNIFRREYLSVHKSSRDPDLIIMAKSTTEYTTNELWGYVRELKKKYTEGEK